MSRNPRIHFSTFPSRRQPLGALASFLRVRLGALLALSSVACADAALVRDGAGPGDSPASVPPNAPSHSGATPQEPNVASLSYCTPQPVTSHQRFALDLFAWVTAHESDTCYTSGLDGSQALYAWAGASAEYPMPMSICVSESGPCYVVLPGFVMTWSEVPQDWAWAPTQEEQWVGVVQATRSVDSGELEVHLSASQFSSSAVIDLQRTYSPEGRVLHEVYSFGGQDWFEVTQEWQGERLMASVVNDFINGSGVTTRTYTWDSKRLLAAGAHRTSDDQTVGATFAYDPQGRLVEATRTSGGAPWIAQTWSYQGHELDQRTSDVHQLESGYYPRLVLDDHEPPWERMVQSAFDASLIRERDGCLALPTTLEHGYPADEQAYDLGWHWSERPPGMDSAYGYGGVYMIAEHGWLGHFGVGPVGWWPSWPEGETRLHHEQEYAQGKMVLERQESFPAGALQIERSRTLAKNRIVRDVLTYSGPYGWQTDTSLDVVMALELTWNQRGQIQDRVLLGNGKTIGHQTWFYDEDGRMTEHFVDMSFSSPLDWPSAVGAPGATPSWPNGSPSTFSITYAAAPVTVTIKQNGELVWERVFNEQGLLSSERSPGITTTFLRGGDGTLLGFDDLDPAGEVVSSLRYSLDNGRVSARTIRYYATAPLSVVRWQHVCP